MPVNGLPPYDTNNIFARILRGEIPCKKVLETEYALAFHDIAPQAPTHILIIPKGAYVSASDFNTQASPEEMAGLWRAVAEVAKPLEATGYRIICNMGVDAGQEVPHFHVHVLGGRPLGVMVAKPA
ncbi:histidine triad nucleotide-binding protein [Rhodovarius lipocyclicus]|uniref:histidine triad nucleotide-binding protein n=1 Tax=Rhodovarius lipocyclicus TaxID=268410 RepID=UPI00135C3CDE|nr:histidine triad nucleotide-binding protein [Rhodovarius lipocyclicus]